MPIDNRDWYRRGDKCPFCGNPVYGSQAHCSFCGRELPPLPLPKRTLDWGRDHGTEKSPDGARENQEDGKKEPPPLQECSLCGKRSLFWNVHNGNYECLNLDCQATGKEPDALFSWKLTMAKIGEKHEDTPALAPKEHARELHRTELRPAKRESSSRGRAWWGNEYYDAKKRKWRRPAKSPLWIVKLCLNLMILIGLGFLIKFGYQVFTQQTEPLKNSVVRILGIAAWILVVRLSKSRRYRWVSPSFKLTAFSAISILVILAFAGVQPLTTYKDAFVTTLVTTIEHVGSREPVVPPEASSREISYTEAQVEALIMGLVNEEREKFGLPALSQHPLLTSLAREHSTSMAENDFFSHDRYPGERDFTHNQPAGTIRGENLSKTPTRRVIPGPYLTLQDVCEWAVSGWMNSPGHRGNILDPRFTKTGVGVSRSGGYVYITQIFEGAY